MSRSTISVLTLVLCGVAVVGGQALMSWRAVAGTGDVAVPDLQGIDALQFSGRGDVQIITDNAPSLTITEAEHSTIKVTRQGSKLVIDVKGWYPGDPHFVLHTAPLRSVELSGSVELNADQLAGKEVQIQTSGSTEAKIAQLNSPTVNIRTSGSTELNISHITAESLDLGASGSTEITLQGNARSQQVHLSGASDYDALQLVSDLVNLTTSGSAEAKVHAVKQLQLDASGGSDIDYAGQPSIQQHVSGSVELNHVDG